MSIDILLSTYNGELYLEEQINSIIKQTFDAWNLLIRDDGSHDGTKLLISKYCTKFPGKIIEISDCYGNVGSTLSFSILLEYSRSDYIMFCDQDDVWLEDKLELSYNEIKRLESMHRNIPLMVFTDLHVVDQHLNVLFDSFIEKQRLLPDVIGDIYKTLALNVVAGCTVIMNNLTKKYVLPFPKFMVHDHWLVINVVNYGVCKYLDKKTMLYRQHSSNVYGSFDINIRYYLKKFILIYKQLNTLFLLKKQLNFKISVIKILYYKCYLSIKRL